MIARFFLTLIILLYAHSAWSFGVGTVGVLGIVEDGESSTCTGDFGETAEGTVNNGNAGFTWVIRTAFDCVASADDLIFNFKLGSTTSDSRRVVLLIYDDNNGEPDGLIWQSDPLYDASWVNQWIDETVAEALSGEYLWIGFHFESSSNIYYYTTNSPTRTTRTIDNTGTFPDVDSEWDTANDSTSDYGFAAYLSGGSL